MDWRDNPYLAPPLNANSCSCSSSFRIFSIFKGRSHHFWCVHHIFFNACCCFMHQGILAGIRLKSTDLQMDGELWIWTTFDYDHQNRGQRMKQQRTTISSKTNTDFLIPDYLCLPSKLCIKVETRIRLKFSIDFIAICFSLLYLPYNKKKGGVLFDVRVITNARGTTLVLQ